MDLFYIPLVLLVVTGAFGELAEWIGQPALVGELVIANFALEAGLFAPPGLVSPILDNLFSAVVIMAVVTTIVTPVLLRRIYPH